MSSLRHPAKAKVPRSLIAALVRPVQRYALARRRTRAAVQRPFQAPKASEAEFLLLHLAAELVRNGSRFGQSPKPEARSKSKEQRSKRFNSRCSAALAHLLWDMHCACFRP
jgi:hypothetical protein